jgi:hypothetical protein
MKDESVYGYRAQLKDKKPLDMDQQRAIVDHAVEIIEGGDGRKSVTMLRQQVA